MFSGPNVVWLNYIPDGSEIAASEKLFKFVVFPDLTWFG